MDFDHAQGSSGVGMQGKFLVQLGPANLFGSPDWEPCFVELAHDLTLRVWASQEEAHEPNAAVSTVKLTFENSVTDLQSKNYSKDPTKSIVLHYFTLYNNKHILPVRLLKVACTASEVEQLEALWNKIRTVVPRHTSVL